jgi:S-adenosylmethionine synthetase
MSSRLAWRTSVQLSYTIGQSRPVSIQAQTFGTGTIPDDTITALVTQHFDFRLASILRQFQLRVLPTRVPGGLYQKLAAYGHVGRMDIGLPWEVTDKAALLQEHKK